MLTIGLCASSLAHASSRQVPHQAPQGQVPEIYSATESSAGVAPTGGEPPIPLSPASKPKTTPHADHANASYDAVPIEQTDAFVKRLQLVSEIIKKFGRAYDYRIHTVKELEFILSQESDARIETRPESLLESGTESDAPSL